MTKSLLAAGVFASALLINIDRVQASALVVDVSPAPGIQTSIFVPPGASVYADLYIISDGVTSMDTYGVSMEYNDVPGVLAPIPGIPTPTAAPAHIPLSPPDSSIFSLAAQPLLDLASQATLIPNDQLASFFFPPGNFGPSGPFTGSDGGCGMFDPNMTPNGFFGSPIIPEAGAMILLQRIRFTAAAPGTTTIHLAGIIDPIPSQPTYPPTEIVIGPPGEPFYDSWSEASIPATAVPFSGFPDPITPATVTVTPEFSTLLSVLLGAPLLLLSRKRHRFPISGLPGQTGQIKNAGN